MDINLSLSFINAVDLKKLYKASLIYPCCHTLLCEGYKS